MKSTRVHRHFSKYILLIITAITAGITPACIDDMIWREDPNSGEGIRFNVDVDGSWQKPRNITRSNGEPVDSMFEKLAAGPSHTIRPMEGKVGGKAVYLHEIVDSWDTGMSKKLESENNNKTRGTVVSGDGADMYSQFGVSAYHYEKSEDWPAQPVSPWPHPGNIGGYYKQPNYFLNLTATGGNGKYSINPTIFWPEKGRARLVAWAPKDDSNIVYYPDINWGSPNGSGLEAVIPTDIDKQKDILIAMPEEQDVESLSSAIDLKFKHALSAIRIALADDMVKCVVEEVKFTHIPSKAYLFFSYTWANNGIPQWDAYQNFTDYTIKPMMEINGPREDQYENRYIDGGDLSKMMFMLPHKLYEGARLTIKIRQRHADGKLAEYSEDISADLTGKYWGPGQIITYRLSYNGWWNGVYFKDRSNDVNSVITGKFDGSFDDGNPDYDHEIDLPYISYNVTNQNVGQRNVDCRLEFNYTDENGVYSGWKRLPPDWLYVDESFCKTVASASDPNSYYTGEGCEDYSKKFRFELIAQDQDMRINWSVDDILYKTPPVGSKENPYNLSNPNGAFGAGYSDSGSGTLYKNTGIHTTANCYMIAAPGWYILPCVYGNAITKSADNVDAYDPARNNASVRNAGEGVLKTFVNHLGNGITHPIIKKNPGCSNPAKAEFVWSDTKVMVENIEYIPNAFSGVGGIRFHISTGDNLAVNPEFKTGINQGNCVIALKDATGANMWSWHIWVNPIPTNRKSLTEIQNKAGDRYKMMAVNLGWISTGELNVYRQRSCLVRMTNENVWDSKRSDPAIVEFFQREHVSYWHGYSPYWQWGRKDPFIPGSYEHTSVAWWQPAENDTTGHGGNMWWGPYPMDSKGAKKKFGDNYEFGSGVSGLKKRVLHPNIWHHDDYFKDYLYDNGNPVLDADGNHKYTERSEDNTFFNLWSAKRTGAWQRPPVGQIATAPPNNYVVKTVYDPCPPGYKVPPLDVFTGITITGDNSSKASDDQKYYNGVHQTYSAIIPWLKIENNQHGEHGFLWKSPQSLNIFKFFADRAHKYTVAFPMSGYRYFVGATLTEIGTDGYYWSAESSSRNRAYYMCYSKGRGVDHVMPLNEYYHLDGMSIRPVLDNDSWEGDQTTTQDSWSRFFDDALWQQQPIPKAIDPDGDNMNYLAVDRGFGIIEMAPSAQEMKKIKNATQKEQMQRNSRRSQPARKSREYNAGDIQRRVSRFLPAVFRDRR